MYILNIQCIYGQNSLKEKALFIVISAANPDPMYKQVTDQVKDAIARGSLASGTKLPSIRQMARELSLSPITIRRAYHDLENEGYLITRAGLGSFVAGISRDELRERKAQEIRDEIRRIVKHAETYGIPIGEIGRIVDEMKKARR